jgi:REP element-mobilizing transposase RayT
MDTPGPDVYPWVMPRKLRPYCPGLGFHIVSHVIGDEPILDASIKERMVDFLRESSTRSDAQVLAFAMMGTHLHLVIRQGMDPLSKLMQPMMCRTALLVRSRRGIRGHVVEGPYRIRPCLSAQHLRDAIVYTHLNPVRAGHAKSADDAQWTSHPAYAAGPRRRDPQLSFLTIAHELFAADPRLAEDRCHQDYLGYVRHRELCDAADRSAASRPQSVPDTTGGDEYFHAYFATSVEPHVPVRLPKRDLRDLALDIVSLEHNGLDLKWLRGSRLGGRQFIQLRTAIIRHAATAGHSPTAIAAFFSMSPNRVSELCHGSCSR